MARFLRKSLVCKSPQFLVVLLIVNTIGKRNKSNVGFEVIGVSFVPLSVPPCAPSGQLHAELWTALGDRIVRLNRKRRWGYVGSRRFPSERGGIIKKR